MTGLWQADPVNLGMACLPIVCLTCELSLCLMGMRSWCLGINNDLSGLQVREPLLLRIITNTLLGNGSCPLPYSLLLNVQQPSWHLQTLSKTSSAESEMDDNTKS